MSFDGRITHIPIPHDAKRGAEARAVQNWAKGAMADLIDGAAGCSPYLATLIAKEGEWLKTASDPEAALAQEAARIRTIAPEEIATELRRAKRRVALLVALADLGGAFALEQATRHLTDFADLAVQSALDAALRRELRRNKLPGMSEDDLATGCGMVVLAMGKMGAGELNYSSDIDLICLFDEDRFAADDYHDARASLIRATRNMAATLNDITGDGYVFRTDLRLRPDPSVTPVCLSMEAAERYYESVGRTWERAAHIKARPCAGDIAAGEAYLNRLRPFIWRKHLDFAAIEDAHDMRLRIRDHKGLGGPISLPGHDVKLGRGGIREIEFFTQTRQIIAGGRDAELRQRETLPALAALAAKGWVPKEVMEVLTGHYRAHRMVEHRLQMVNDAQTHALPRDADGFARLAAMFGRTDVAGMEEELRHRLAEVHDTTEGFFAPADRGGAALELSDIAEDIIARWPSYPALRSTRAQEVFRRLRPEILKRMQNAARPDEALQQFDRFLAGLPAGVQLFSLFEANLQLIDLLVDICGTAPALAQHLSQNAKVFDAVIGGSFFDPWPGVQTLSEQISEALASVTDYEAKLDMARRQMQEWHFRIGVHHLRGLISGSAAGAQYAELAEAVVATLWPVVVAEFARKHGDPPGQGAAVIAMGSLGAGRITAQSDLDLIVIYDAEGEAMSDGRRPLQSRPYYARLTQALVTALTAPMAEGRLYEVDMRLRPSGRQGPVATSLASFTNYQLEEAWTWEHLALTRARGIAGSKEVIVAVEMFRPELLKVKADAAKVLPDMAEMRARLAEAKPAESPWETKRGTGRLQDIELLGQALALTAANSARDLMGQLAAGVDLLGDQSFADLNQAQDLLWQLRMAEKLLTDKPLDMEAIGKGGQDFVLRECGAETVDKLKATIETQSANVDAIINTVIAGKGRAG